VVAKHFGSGDVRGKEEAFCPVALWQSAIGVVEFEALEKGESGECIEIGELGMVKGHSDKVRQSDTAACGVGLCVEQVEQK